ncbi:hypothetical protein ACQV2C_13450 [Pantoea allii]|uniref:hypothetical protein n=1 Tax=Pantoea allii TaxID=574096 RepID=UPI00155F82B5|nr:hypothetical protein [Pantoea allii]NQS86274.1 hypothetical protein [Pantoea allii]
MAATDTLTPGIVGATAPPLFGAVVCPLLSAHRQSRSERRIGDHATVSGLPEHKEPQPRLLPEPHAVGQHRQV